MHNIRQILKQYWGFDSFRPLQEEIILSVLNGNDALALLPTGGGKSLCFQVPALALPGMCVVVSPLIALMKDQVYNLQKKGIAAAAVYSGMPKRVTDIVLDNCLLGKVKFLYLSPERLATEEFRARLPKMNVSLLAVDEAHCISQWGYDFRPPYLKIAEVRDMLGKVPVIALTATATPEVTEDIQNKLHFGRRNVLQKSFLRKNLSYVVRKVANKELALADILKKVNGSAVVYVRNRKRTRDYSDFLKKQGISADYYHAGLDPSVRSKKQDQWIKNKTRVICCTNAFGMGIDKPDVRLVIHMDLADSPEAYFQEAGRAGRDEQKAYAVQLIDQSDLVEIDKKIKSGFPDIEFIKEVYDQLCIFLQIPYHSGQYQWFNFAVEQFTAKHKLNAMQTMTALKVLEQQELLTATDSIYNLSQIKCVCSKEVLFSFQERHKTLEPLIKFILRTSEGVFEDYVPLDEEAISVRLKVSVEQVTAYLHDLHRLHIFSYQPRSSRAQIQLLQNRIKRQELRLDTIYIEKRKQDYEQRLKAIRYYVTENTHCRSRILVKYFGEMLNENCGICDVCVAQKRTGLSNELFADIINRVKQELNKQPLTMAQLQQQLNIKTDLLSHICDYLIDHQIIAINNHQQIEWQG